MIRHHYYGMIWSTPVYHTPTNLVAVDKNGQELSEGDIVYYNDGEDFAGDVMNIFEDRGVWLVDILPHHDNNYFRCEAREVEIA